MTTRTSRERTTRPGLIMPCTHPPDRLYTGTATNYERDTEGHWHAVPARWIACCQCGAVLHGGWQPDDQNDTKETERTERSGTCTNTHHNHNKRKHYPDAHRHTAAPFPCRHRLPHLSAWGTRWANRLPQSRATTVVAPHMKEE